MKSKVPHRNKTLRFSLILAITIFGIFGPKMKGWAVCTPSAVTMILGFDDRATVWINGNSVTVNASEPGSGPTSYPITLTINTAFMASGSNNIAVSVYNSNAGYVWAAWDLKVTCAEGGTFDVNSNSGNVELYNYNPKYSTSFIGSAGYPANDSSGVTWWNPNYNWSSIVGWT